MFDKKVTIIGAGPAGLMLARLLQKRGVHVEVFEGESSSVHRDQGGTLDMHDDKGQLAIKEAGLENEFKRLARPEGQSTKILDKYGSIMFSEDSEVDDFSRPEIDRQHLRNILLSSLEEGTVAWNKPVVSIESVSKEGVAGEMDDARHVILFKDGTKTETDLLIGCDGAWSKVRSSFSPIRPNYTGVSFVETGIVNPEETAPSIAKLVGTGSAFALSDNKGFMAQRNSDKRIRTYVTFRVPEDYFNKVDFSDPLRVRSTLLQEFKDWDPMLLDMLNLSEDKFILRPIYALPSEYEWKRVPGVTIIGDAAHVMSPFAGLGANLALLDALELAECLTGNEYTNLESALEKFEKKMFERSKEAAEETEASLNICLAEDAPKQLVEVMKSHGPENH